MSSLPGESEETSIRLPKVGLEILGDLLIRTTPGGQRIVHRIGSLTDVAFSVGNNLAVPAIDAVILAVAGLAFYLIPIPWLAWTILIATIAFVSFSMFGMRTPLLTFFDEGVRFRYPLIGHPDEVAAFTVAVRRVLRGVTDAP